MVTARPVTLHEMTTRPGGADHVAVARALEQRGIAHVAELLERARLEPAIRAMAERQPPLYMDVSNAYSGDELGLPWRDIIGEGVVSAGDLAVTGQAGSNSVNIAAGHAWVLGDTNVDLQPIYRVYNDAVVNRGTAPDPANPRRALIVAQIIDQAFAGVGRLWSIDAILGTPAASPTLPATPASALPLADILIPAAAANSGAYTFTDLRVRASIGQGKALAGGGGGGGGIALWPATGTDAGNAFWTVAGLSQWEAGHYEFVKDVSGRLHGLFKAGGSLTNVVLSLGANATSGITRMHVHVTPVGDGESLNPGATALTVTQDVTVPGTARQRKDVTFNVSAAGVAAGDLVILQIRHEGTHANDTLAVNTELYGVDVS